MKILGIDYGSKKIGVAIGDTENKFAEPLMVIRYKTIEEGIQKIEQVIQIEKATQIVLGLSEGKTAMKTKEFAEVLKRKLQTPIVYEDETLSTLDAQKLSIEAGIKRKKRRGLEDAYAAAITLQNYLLST